MRHAITKDTTDEDLLATVRLSKENLRQKLDEERRDKWDAERLAKEVNGLAENEGRLFVRVQYRNALAQDASPEAIRRHLTKLVLNHPDDEWSGRSNDVRRAKADGVRNEVASILELLDRQARSK